MKLDQLTEENFSKFAIESYTHYHCSGDDEFQEDLLHVKYLKRLFRKYIEVGTMDVSRIRLALNHLIIFYNVFQREPATRILFFKLEPSLYKILKTFLTYLSLMPAEVRGINGKTIRSKDIKVDQVILKKLQNT
jgi:hypothetical protein